VGDNQNDPRQPGLERHLFEENSMFARKESSFVYVSAQGPTTIYHRSGSITEATSLAKGRSLISGLDKVNQKNKKITYSGAIKYESVLSRRLNDLRASPGEFSLGQRACWISKEALHAGPGMADKKVEGEDAGRIISRLRGSNDTTTPSANGLGAAGKSP
jgi:hypothetical protein